MPKRDVRDLASTTVSHIVLTHNHFDHIRDSSPFVGAEIYCASAVAATMAASSANASIGSYSLITNSTRA